MYNDKTSMQQHVDAKGPYNVLGLVDFWCVLAGYSAQWDVESAGGEPGKVVSCQFVNIFACHHEKSEFYLVVSGESQIMMAIVFRFSQLYPVVNSGTSQNEEQ